ncbi:MAG TPA: NAD-dependent epimerase/dehydratase family protein [Chthoniobacterales bacterium]|nr:NAD-dependent epimerase/dehydratase family protein [Chthoniobacterales bacterium]
MPRVLIAGCGYLGRAIADLLTVDGWQVEGWTMSPESAADLSVAGHVAKTVDISDRNSVARQGSQFDAVIQSASTRGGDAESYQRVYLHGAHNLVEQFRNARFFFVSSTSVYSQTSGEWVSEENEAEPKHQTGEILRRTEDFVLEKGGTVVRLAGLYGPNRSALLRKFLAGEARIDPDNDRFINQIHRDDAAAAFQFLITRSNTASQVYNLVDNQPMLLGECYRWLAARLNRPVPPEEASTSRRKRGDSNKRVSNAKLRGLGWVPLYPSFADGMDRSVLSNIIGRDA